MLHSVTWRIHFYVHVFHVFSRACCVLHTVSCTLPQNYRSVLQNIVSFVGLFCKRGLLHVAKCYIVYYARCRR